MLNDIKMKKSVAELGHSDHLKVYIDSAKFKLTLAFKSISPEWYSIFG